MERRTFIRPDQALLPSLQEALNFARSAHEGQRRRQDNRPFIEHPIAVAALLADHGVSEVVLAAGYLHDTVEKSPTVGLPDLEERFGAEVAAIVAALTEDPAIDDYEERKQALRVRALSSGPEAGIVYAADRLANMRDWQQLDPEERLAAAARLGTNLPCRLSLWEEDLRELTDFEGDLPFLAEIEIALADLRSRRARA